MSRLEPDPSARRACYDMGPTVPADAGNPMRPTTRRAATTQTRPEVAPDVFGSEVPWRRSLLDPLQRLELRWMR